MDIELDIYDGNLVLKGIIDVFTSLIWTRKFFEAGAFSLTCAANEYNANLLKKHYFVVKKDSDEVGFIDAIGITSNEDTNEIRVSGHFLTGFLDKRIIHSIAYSDTFFDVIDKNIGEMAEENRRIPLLKIDKSMVIPCEYHSQLKYQNLGEYAKAICMLHSFGLTCRVLHDENSNPYFYLEGRYGTDYSINQTENPQMVFSYEFDNLLSTEYSYSDVGACTTVYGYSIADPDADGTPPTYTKGTEHAGIDRIEKSASVNCITERYEIQVQGGSIPAQRIVEYETALALRTQCENVDAPATENMQGDVLVSNTSYKKDYDLGDVVTVFNDKWGVVLSQRIYELSEVYEGGDCKIYPTFGTPQKTLSEILKR